MRGRRRSCCRRSVKPVAGANATPSNVTPPEPPLPPLAAKSLGFNTEATTYHVYDVTPPRDAGAQPDPFAIKLPAPLTPAPVADTEFVIKGVAFGVERCFEVRPVDSVFGAMVHRAGLAAHVRHAEGHVPAGRAASRSPRSPAPA